MKQLSFFIIGLLLFASSCNSSKSTDTETSTEENTELTNEDENNETKEDEELSTQGSDILPTEKPDYQEFYETGELKIEGNFDEEENRHGLWVSYYETGLKWSESYYVHGVKNGHSVTFFPNGKIRYVGEYKEDEKVGRWTFYDEEGNVVQEENY